MGPNSNSSLGHLIVFFLIPLLQRSPWAIYLFIAVLIVVLEAAFLLSPVHVFTAPPAFRRGLEKPVVNKYLLSG